MPLGSATGFSPFPVQKLTTQLSKSTRASKEIVIMVPHFQCILISLEKATQSTPEEADLITEHTEALFKEHKKAHRKAQSEGMEGVLQVASVNHRSSAGKSKL